MWIAAIYESIEDIKGAQTTAVAIFLARKGTSKKEIRSNESIQFSSFLEYPIKNDYICHVEYLIFCFMLTRTQVFDTLEKMPEQFSIDQLFDKLLFINKVEIGLAQSENGQVNTKEQAKQKLSKWLK